MRTLLLCALTLAGCGGTDASDPGDEMSPATQILCTPEDRVGTYLASFSERSGNCGPVPETVGRLTADYLPDGCELDMPDVWSEDNCKLERAYTCATPDGVSSFVGVSHQITEDGSRMTGIVTAQVRNSLGQTLCSSTYDVTWERL